MSETLPLPLESARLILRRFTPNDLAALSRIVRDKMSGDTAAYDSPFPTDPAGLQAVLGYFASGDEFFAITRPSDGEMIGYASLNREEDTRNLGFCVRSDCRQQGYATEAARCLMAYAKRELGLSRLLSGTAEENPAALRVLEKCGFHITGRSRASFVNDAAGNPIEFTACSLECAL